MSKPAAPQTGAFSTHGRAHRAAGWAVHALTASGAVIGLLAIIAITRDDARAALLWLGAAFAVDALDGPIARRLRVRDVLPKVDGEVLDLVVDYLNYVVVPAAFLYWFDLMPAGWGLPAAGFVLLTSLYCFANVEMKTEDNYFAGFPAIWNVVVLYLWLLETPVLLNAIIVAVLGILTFVPVKFVHPIRVREGREVTWIALLIWAVCAVALLVMSPASTWWLLGPWLGATGWLAFVSLRRTVRGPARD
jgi:phosphatidylcholine synthase